MGETKGKGGRYLGRKILPLHLREHFFFFFVGNAGRRESINPLGVSPALLSVRWVHRRLGRMERGHKI